MSPTLLPLINSPRHGSRSSMTCHYRCNKACDAPVPNESDNARMRDLVEGALARRSLLKGGAAGAGALVLAGLGDGLPRGRRVERPLGQGSPHHAQPRPSGLHPGRPQPCRRGDQRARLHPQRRHPLGRPGRGRRSPLRRRGPDARGAGQAVRLQQRLRRRVAPARAPGPARHQPRVHRREPHVPRPGPTTTRRQEDRDGRPRHGCRDVERGRRPGSWVRSDHRRAVHNRRITAAPPSPSRARPRVTSCCSTPRPGRRTILGTFGNCAGGTTPWGTVLSGEENFNGYFDASGPVDLAPHDVLQALRPRDHHRDQPWLVERRRALRPRQAPPRGLPLRLDRRDRPARPESAPSQADVLGRFKHEGANVSPRAGRPRGRLHGRRRARRLPLQVRLGRRRFRKGGSTAARTHNKGPARPGTLYVAPLQR